MNDVRVQAITYVKFLEFLIQCQKDHSLHSPSPTALADSRALIERFRRTIADIEREYLSKTDPKESPDRDRTLARGHHAARRRRPHAL